MLLNLKKEYQDNLLLLEQQRTRDNQSKRSIRQGLIKLKMKDINDVNAIIRQQNVQMHEKMTELKVVSYQQSNNSNTNTSNVNTNPIKEHLL